MEKMNGHDYQNRVNQVKRCIPQLFKAKTILYIGGHARHNRNLQLSDELLKAGATIDVVEVFKENCDQMREKFKWIRNIYHSDIMDFEPDNYDAIIFWHGPEHLTKEQTFELTEKLKYKCDLLVYATPWGKSPQGAEYGNENEVHVSTWYQRDFVEMGFLVDAIGEKDVLLKNNLLAWK